MNPNPVMFSNTQHYQSTIGLKNVNQHSNGPQKQKPKPPVRQFRQNIAPYSTLQQPASKTMHGLQTSQTISDPSRDWTFNPFEVTVKRNSLGLGMSIMGGPEANFPYAKLIRIKKIFPLQPAWETGRLKIGDILLSAGGVPMSGLTIRQAIDVLRSSHSGSKTRLVICRPPSDNHPCQVFDEIFNKVNVKETRTPEKDIDMADRPKPVHRSYSTCISTSINTNNMIQCGTPSKGPLSISLFPNSQSTTIFCPSSPTKPKRNTPDKQKIKTTSDSLEQATKMHVSTAKVDVTCDSNRSSSPMDVEDCPPSDLSIALDDSVQSFTQSNGVNGPVYVDNSPEREEEDRLTVMHDNISGNYRASSKENFNKINEADVSNISLTKINKHILEIGSLDLLKEIPAQVTPRYTNGESISEKYGEFSIKIKKINGSLGFTLCQTDESTVLRHTIKALVKEPALSDGRIRPGDKLISANGTDCSSLSHTELITYLRNIGNDRNGNEIELKLYRDASESQTPITPPAISNTEDSNIAFSSFHEQSDKVAAKSHPNLPTFLNNLSNHSSHGSNGKNQKRLRQEAKEMVRSLQASRSSLDGSSKSSGTDNLFQSSRNGSNASASSNSANRYKRNLVQRPHSPIALLSSQNSSSLTKSSATTSESTSPDDSIIYEDNLKNISSNCGQNSRRKQLYNKKNSDSRLYSHSLPNTDIFNNQNNTRNAIYNIDLTNEGLQRLKIEGYSNDRKTDDLSEENSIIPPLRKVENSFKTLISSNAASENQDSLLSMQMNNGPSKINVVRLGNGQCHRPSDLDLLSNEKRKAHGYIFHTFGYKSDATN